MFCFFFPEPKVTRKVFSKASRFRKGPLSDLGIKQTVLLHLIYYLLATTEGKMLITEQLHAFMSRGRGKWGSAEGAEFYSLL